MALTKMTADVETSGGKGRAKGPLNENAVQSYTSPSTFTPAPITFDTWGASAAPSATPGGGGGGGGGSIAAPQRPSLDDFIKSNFLYTQTENEGRRRLDDFDAESLRMQQDTEAEQRVRRGGLQRDLADASLANSEGLAGRGLLRSGFLFQNQDRINTMGMEKENDIASMLTELLSGRQQGRRQAEASNRDALNQQIQKLTDQFNAQQQIVG